MKTMKMTNLMLVAGLGSAWLACNPAPQTDAMDTALNQSYGALDEADEAPDFGDEEIASEPDLTDAEDVAVEDSVADSDPTLAEAEADQVTPPHKLIIAVMWGHLRPQPDATEITDWSGTIVATNAALRVRRTIRFDQGDALLPRTSISEVPFTSITAPHADGLVLEVILHRALVTEPGVLPSLSFESAAYSDQLVLRPGMRLSRVVPVDETGNAVVYHIFRPDADGCQEGLLIGRYSELRTTDDGRELGQIKGKYLSFDGSVGGKIKGIYGVRENGAQVFFAKVIKRDGSFRGILAGRYGAGHLAGRYLGKGRTVHGAVVGIYRAGRVEEGGGFFAGRWSIACGELSSEGAVEASDEANQQVDSELPSE